MTERGKLYLRSLSLNALDHTWCRCEAVSFVSLIIFNLKLYQVTDRLQARDLVSLPTSSLACSTHGHAMANTQLHANTLRGAPAELQPSPSKTNAFNDSYRRFARPLAWSVFFSLSLFHTITDHKFLSPFCFDTVSLPKH